MTTITTVKSDTKFFDLPKNKTGLFAADTIHEVKPKRNYLATVPPLSTQFRHNVSTNLLLASSEQNQHLLQQNRSSTNEIQQYYPIDKNHSSTIDSANDSRVTQNGIRNGFRASTVRHQKLRLTTAIAQRPNSYYENKDVSRKSAFIPSHGSVKLRSEIDHINNQLTKHNKEPSKSLRILHSRELNDTPLSGMSYSTSYRVSSASSVLTADRIHQRFSSAITSNTTHTRPTMPTIQDTSNRSTQVFSSITGRSPSQPTNETDYRSTHAYQVPQQSNVGSESIFLMNPPPILSMKTRSTKYGGRSKDLKSISCPFYVMYLTNLTMQQQQQQQQQQQNKENNTTNKENDITKFAMSSVIRKVPVNSRTSTANPRRQSTRRQVNSPISIKTYSTVDDDDHHMTNSAHIFYNKRLPTKTSTGENENSHMLRDILQTKSWNHVQV